MFTILGFLVVVFLLLGLTAILSIALIIGGEGLSPLFSEHSSRIVQLWWICAVALDIWLWQYILANSPFTIVAT